MREIGVLDLSDAIHIECERFCFIPFIQNDLDRVIDTLNNHRNENLTHLVQGVVHPCVATQKYLTVAI